MKYYINIVFILSAIFFSCAVQSPPTGGASDTQGPYIKSIDPPNGTFYFKGDIEIVFNEMIDPNTIKSSISIFPDTPVQISSFNNRIVIKSQNQWPKDQIFKIHNAVDDPEKREAHLVIRIYHDLTSLPVNLNIVSVDDIDL